MDEWGAPGGMRFSAREAHHLLASIVALTVVFLIHRWTVVTNKSLLAPGQFSLGQLLSAESLGIALGAVVTGFLFHELAHKFAAQAYGHWSEFRASFAPMAVAPFIALFFGILVCAPGAVNIVGNVSRRQNGVICAVGPLTNLAMAAAFTVLWWGNPGRLARDILFSAAFLNISLAGFNLIPLHPLDGSKIVRWNLGIYFLMIIIIVFELKVLEPNLFPFLP